MAGPSRLGFVCTHLCFAGTAGARVRQVHVQMNGILRVILEGLRVIAIHMTVCAVLLDVCWGFVGGFVVCGVAGLWVVLCTSFGVCVRGSGSVPCHMGQTWAMCGADFCGDL